MKTSFSQYLIALLLSLGLLLAASQNFMASDSDSAGIVSDLSDKFFVGSAVTNGREDLITLHITPFEASPGRILFNYRLNTKNSFSEGNGKINPQQGWLIFDRGDSCKYYRHNDGKFRIESPRLNHGHFWKLEEK